MYVEDVEIARRGRVGAAVAWRAGELLRDRAGRVEHVDHKGPVDLVTEADRASQQRLVTALREAFPHDTIVAEEDACALQGESGYVWLLDPLDGTTNFVHGYLPYAVTVGLLRDGATVWGAVCLPASGELFVAARGAGAWCNGRPIAVSRTPRLSASLLATGFPYDRRDHVDALLQPVRRAILSAHGFRRSGSAAYDLCCVACGRLDGFWERGLKPWDLAAGCLLVEEAGGRVTDFDGGCHDLQAGRTVASNGRIHEEMLQVLLGA